MLSFNVWIRCETYGTTFSRIIDAVNGSAAVEKYVRDLIERHGLNRADLTVCLVQEVLKP
jgi:ribosomal protein L20A (L18A)